MQQTSLAAYRSVKRDGTIANQQSQILAALETFGPGNAWQISQRIGLGKHEVGRRMSELRDAGKIYDTGKKAATDTNRAAIVYDVVRAEKAAAA